ncbi:MAG: type I secretion system permease/ATPase [Azoarcus sp.]|jgi:ATP-binding cassette subfamily C exporter for protease/lipase|nr:type I secretion system permease/ATPase [Azoarcus sp.]
MNLEAVVPEARAALGAQRPMFLRAALFSAVIGALMLAPSFYMLEVYDRVITSRSVRTLIMLTLLLALAYGVLHLLQWARQGVLRQAAEGFDRELGARIHAVVFRAGLLGTRALAQRGLHDFATVREFVGGTMMAGLMDIPMALLLVGVIFCIDPVLGWFALASAVVQGLLAFFNKQATGAPMAKANALHAQARNFVAASLGRADVARAMGMTEGLRQRWLKTQEELLRLQARASDRAGVFTTLSKHVQLLSGSLMLGLGAWLLLDGNFSGSSGGILMASILAGRALGPLVQVIVGWRQVVDARESFARLEELLSRIPAFKPGLPLPVPHGRLTVENVTARAPGMSAQAKPVLRNIAFELPPGKVLAVVGPSASGKSTLAHLLVGAWPCHAGAVRLDGADVFVWNKQELGPHIGFLAQDVALFPGTIAQNIARLGEIDSEKIKVAAQIAGVHAEIQALPDGYETSIGEDGWILSGGLCQRIGLARALYGAPKLVVLDEPDANLDEAGDMALIQALHTLRAQGTTVIVVTHRMNLLMMADAMLLLVDGEVRSFGSPAEVLNAGRTPPGGAVRPMRAPVAAIHATRPTARA